MNRMIVLLAAALLPAGIAHASETDEAASLGIRVHGDVEQQCQISAPKSVDLGNLERSYVAAELNIGFKCNTPFVMQIQASKGALTNLTSPQGDGPYAGSLPYSLGVALPVRHPATQLISKTFNSRDLIGGQQVSSQGGIASDGFRMTLVSGVPAGGAGLLAGDYADTLTISVSVI